MKTDKEYLEEHGYDAHSIIEWPESQMLMEQEWFFECTLILDDVGMEMYGSSAYIIPNEYVATF